MADITAVLSATTSPDAATREAAEAQLKQAQEQNLGAFLQSLANEVATEAKPLDSRRLAGLILKNALDARDETVKADKQEKWVTMDANIRNTVKGCVWNQLGSPVQEIRHTCAQVIAKIAGAEMPKALWPSLVTDLQNNMATGDPGKRQSTLEALGYICEEIEHEHLQEADVNAMLTAIVQGMRKEEESNEIRLAATNALVNAMYFAEGNFEREQERNYIMQVTCEATVCADVRVRQAAFEVLVGAAENYYEKLQPYMTAIFDLTVKATKGDEESVALQAIEFWSAIADEEVCRQDEIADAGEGNHQIVYHRFVEQALPHLVPMLLETLTKQDEDELDEGDDVWNLAMAGGTCLGLVATCVQDAVVDHVMPFITGNIGSQEWRLREAATFAFGSILEGPDPDKLAPVAAQALPFLLNALNDPKTHVRDTTAWTIGRVFEFVGEAQSPVVNPGNLDGILKILVEKLQDKPLVAGKVCYALLRLATSCANDDDEQNPMRVALAPYFQGIVQSLLQTSERPDAEQSLRMECYESLNEIIRASTQQNAPITQQLVPMVLQKLETTLAALSQPGLGPEAQEKIGEVQGLLCGTLQTIVQKLSGEDATKMMIIQFGDQIMQMLLRVLGARSATVHEEAMLCVGALAYATGDQFEKYMQALYPFIEVGLKNHEEYEVCNVTVGVVGDLCRALDAKILPFCDGIVYQLLQDLQSTALHRSVKPPILSCFGDIALAIGPAFEKYVGYVVPMLQSAQQLSLQTPKDDEEMIEYNNMLRNGIFEAYAGLLQGFKDDKSKVEQLKSHAVYVLQFIAEVAKDRDRDEAVTRAMVGVMGDMADTMDGVGELFKQNMFWVDLIRECEDQYQDQQLRDTAQWAKGKITMRVGM